MVTPCPTRALARQRGYALLTVMMLGTMAAFGAGALMRHDAVLERRAVSESLARTRAYWAAMGQINYVASRIRQNGYKNGVGSSASDTQRANTLNSSYIAELNSYKTWQYPASNSDYFLTVSTTAAIENASYNNNSGYEKLIVTFPTASQSTLPVLSGLNNRLRSVQFHFCMVASATSTACTAPSSAHAGADDSEFFLVTGIDRPPLS